MTGHSFFFVGFPHQYKAFLLNTHVPRVYDLDLKFHNLFPFFMFSINPADFLVQKGTNCEILNMNNVTNHFKNLFE